MQINNYYNFSLYPNSVIGTLFRNAKLISILDYNIALKFANIELYQKQIFPYLPEGTSSNYTNYTYYLFLYKNKKIIIANTWIIPTSIEVSSANTYTITLENISTSQLNIIRDQLRVLGISFTISSN